MSALKSLSAAEIMECILSVNGRGVRQEIRDRLDRLEKCEAALRWALGEIGDFPERRFGQPAYWWRTELRKRAALEDR